MHHVLRIDKFPEHLPNHDGYNFLRPYGHRRSGNIYERYPDRYPKQYTPSPTYCAPSTGQVKRTRLIPQTGKVHLQSTGNRIPGVNHWWRKSTHGPHKSPGSRQMEMPKNPHRTTRMDGLH